MATAKDYPVTFGYKAQDGYYYGPNGTVGPYHRGNDRAMPIGVPIKIGDTTIGWSGNSGKSGGAHLHTQAMLASDVNPTPYEFKPGLVQEVGYMPDFGNYVKVLVGKVKVYYAHMSKTNAKVGQVIKAEEALMLEEQRPVFRADYYLKVNPDVAKKYNLKNAVEHWKKYGIKEGRASAPNLHVKEYLANYADLRRVYGDKGYAKAVKHYFNFGINEGRSGRKRNPVVNTAQATLDKIKALIGK